MKLLIFSFQSLIRSKAEISVTFSLEYLHTAVILNIFIIMIHTNIYEYCLSIVWWWTNDMNRARFSVLIPTYVQSMHMNICFYCFYHKAYHWRFFLFPIFFYWCLLFLLRFHQYRGFRGSSQSYIFFFIINNWIDVLVVFWVRVCSLVFGKGKFCVNNNTCLTPKPIIMMDIIL